MHLNYLNFFHFHIILFKCAENCIKVNFKILWIRQLIRMKRLNLCRILDYTYKKITTAGTVIAPPSRKKAPGSVFMVAAYTEAYSGEQINGTSASATPNSEFTFPISSLVTSFEAIERIAMNEVPFRISTIEAVFVVKIHLPIRIFKKRK